MPPINRFESGRDGLTRNLPVTNHIATRRKFLQLSAAALSGVVLSNCAGNIASSGGESPAASPAATGGSPAGDASGTLNIYTWENYVDDELIKAFQDKTGIRVVADIFDSNETMLAKLQAGGSGAYSIIYPSDYMVTQMMELNLLKPLDRPQVQFQGSLLPQWQNPPYDPENKHSVPFAWGTTGLAYNSGGLNPPPTDWDYLWQNQDKLRRKMTMLNDVREVFGAALKSLGYSNSTTDPNQIREAYEKLRELRPLLNSFTTDGWRDQMVVGDLILSHAYSIDGVEVGRENNQVKYVVPASGATVWTDTMAIPKDAPNVAAAYAWMNFVNDPAVTSTFVTRRKFAIPNKDTIALLPAELKGNTSLFPTDAVLAKCEPLGSVGDAIDIYDRYWTQLTSA